MRRLAAWERTHPHGPMTAQESETYNNLVLYAIGSRMLKFGTENKPFRKDWILNQLHEKVEDWMV
jgi:hypothetical protein